jgi:ATP-dependent Clp protease protease subunit
VLLHQPSARGQGTIPDLILQAEEIIRVRSEAEQVLSLHTGQTVETLRRDTDRDRIFTPEQAVAYGLADTVMPARRDLALALAPGPQPDRV